jgi:hypothetical protein
MGTSHDARRFAKCAFTRPEVRMTSPWSLPTTLTVTVHAISDAGGRLSRAFPRWDSSSSAAIRAAR